MLAGGNGAGKSTFYRLYLQTRGLRFVNADLIAQRIAPGRPAEASHEAAAWAAKLRQRLLAEGRSFCFETVFSHPSKVDFVAEAKALGYEIILVYVHLAHASLNRARVCQRVSEGGHDVPEDKITSRLPRTERNVAAALPLVDEAWLLDNSSRDEPFRCVARMRRGTLTERSAPLPEWALRVLGATRTEP